MNLEKILQIAIMPIVLLIAGYFIGIFKEGFSNKRALLLEQRQKYLLHFKFYADEVRRRLMHIEKRLSVLNEPEKNEKMYHRLHQVLKTHNLEWYFNDSIGPEGGYFVTSTMYMY
jgi:hypothetical protein